MRHSEYLINGTMMTGTNSAGPLVNIVEKVFGSPVSVQRHGKRIDIDLASEEHQETAIKCLKEADPGDPATNLARVFYDQPPLFD